MKTRYKLFAALLVLVIFCFSFTGCIKKGENSDQSSSLQSSQQSDSSKDGNNSKNSESSAPAQRGSKTIKICAGGDTMVHEGQLISAKGSDGIYDFTENFQFVSKYFKSADIALVNLETVFAGADRKYTGFPVFNTPDALAYALKGAGVTAVCTSNNHCWDKGVSGLKRTIDVLKESGLEYFGTRKSESDAGYIVKEVNGIKVGIFAYTYQTKSGPDEKHINGLKVDKAHHSLIDSFSYTELQRDLKAIEKRVNEIKEKGAEFIIAYMHWGTEYHLTENDYQRNIAKALSDYGVDIIFGNHPHVVQPITLIQSEKSGKNTLVAYAMGNLISNQREETLPSYKNRAYTENSVLLYVTVKKDFDKNEIKIEKAEYIPLWVNKYKKGGRNVFEIVPCSPALKSPENYNIVTQQQKARVERSFNATTHNVTSKYTDEMKKIVPFSLYKD